MKYYKKLIIYIISFTFIINTISFLAGAAGSAPVTVTVEIEQRRAAAEAAGAIPVSTAQELYDIRDNMYGYYLLTNDIDLSDFMGGYWVPIGDNHALFNATDFNGIIDGDGYKISGMNIKTDGLTSGLICLLTGVVMNLTIEGVNNSSRPFSGGFVGYNLGTIRNCAFDGEIGSNSFCGGIAGFNETNGVIEKCINYSSIHYINIGPAHLVGGITGLNRGYITESYNQGNIGSDSDSIIAGGIAGDIWAGTISNCFNSGSIRGKLIVGGIIGKIENDPEDNKNGPVLIKNCYNMGYVHYESKYAGAIHSDYVADATDIINVENCHDMVTKPVNAEQMGSSYADDALKNNRGFPVLKWTTETPKSIIESSRNRLAKPVHLEVLINGIKTMLPAYTIDDYNYISVQDLLYVLSSVQKPFAVRWDTDSEFIYLTTNTKYTNNDYEMVRINNKTKIVSPTNAWPIINTNEYIDEDDYLMKIASYYINGKYYFKLRHLAWFYSFNVDWDDESGAVIVEFQ